jgi:hypothetical protein
LLTFLFQLVERGCFIQNLSRNDIQNLVDEISYEVLLSQRQQQLFLKETQRQQKMERGQQRKAQKRHQEEQGGREAPQKRHLEEQGGPIQGKSDDPHSPSLHESLNVLRLGDPNDLLQGGEGALTPVFGGGSDELPRLFGGDFPAEGQKVDPGEIYGVAGGGLPEEPTEETQEINFSPAPAHPSPRKRRRPTPEEREIISHVMPLVSDFAGTEKCQWLYKFSAEPGAQIFGPFLTTHMLTWLDEDWFTSVEEVWVKAVDCVGYLEFITDRQLRVNESEGEEEGEGMEEDFGECPWVSSSQMDLGILFEALGKSRSSNRGKKKRGSDGPAGLLEEKERKRSRKHRVEETGGQPEKRQREREGAEGDRRRRVEPNRPTDGLFDQNGGFEHFPKKHKLHQEETVDGRKRVKKERAMGSKREREERSLSNEHPSLGSF